MLYIPPICNCTNVQLFIVQPTVETCRTPGGLEALTSTKRWWWQKFWNGKLFWWLNFWHGKQFITIRVFWWLNFWHRKQFITIRVCGPGCLVPLGPTNTGGRGNPTRSDVDNIENIFFLIRASIYTILFLEVMNKLIFNYFLSFSNPEWQRGLSCHWPPAGRLWGETADCQS